MESPTIICEYKVRPTQVHANVVDAVIVDQLRQEWPAFQERLYRL